MGLIHYDSCAGMSRADWLAYRFRGIGASETGAILGLSPYKHAAHVFYEKIGEPVRDDDESLAAFLGKQQEPFLDHLWQHWDGTIEGMMANVYAGTPVRKSRKIDAYIWNEKWPWLFVSLDREILPHHNRGAGALELKTMGSYEADKWQNGIPPSHVMQVTQQCGVAEYMYGELAAMKDNRDFLVLPFEFSREIMDTIVDRTKVFWDSVLSARKLKKEKEKYAKRGDFKGVEEMTAAISSLEPSADDTVNYQDFLKERYKIADTETIEGNAEMFAEAVMAFKAAQQCKESEATERLHVNRIKAMIGTLNVAKITFGENGYVSWKADSNGVRKFLNKIKNFE